VVKVATKRKPRATKAVKDKIKAEVVELEEAVLKKRGRPRKKKDL